jgi:subtilisin family serine protease
MYGPYIDFAAPGFEVFSTTTGSGYAYGTGCSFAAPLVAGVVAWIFGLNPTLPPGDVIGILTNTAVDLGAPGWDEYFGWGRVDFAAAAAAAVATLPNITAVQWSNAAVIVTSNVRAGLAYSLWRSVQLTPPAWEQVSGALSAINGSAVALTDPRPPNGGAFYRVQASVNKPP